MEVNTRMDYLILALFEVMGTSILTIGLNFGYKKGPDCVSSGLFVAILLTKRVTGSHLNAGITIGVGIVEKATEDKKKMLIGLTYILAQLLGGYIGMAISYLILDDASMNMSPGLNNDNLLYLSFVEFIFSWIFITIYLYAKCDWVAPSQDFGLRAFTMMGVYYACISMVQRITGGALNPTIGFCAPTFHAAFVSGDASNLKYVVAYMIGPILSGVLAGLFLRFFAIKHTPQSNTIHGSPFLANKMRRTVSEQSKSPNSN